MKKDRFAIEVVPHSSIAWQVKDNVSGLGILFYEGVFFPNKVLQIPDSLKGEDKKKELYHIADEIYHEGRIDPDGLAAVSRVAGHDYAEIGHQFTIARPD